MTDPDQSLAYWGSYWRNRAERETGAPPVGVGIESAEELSAYWQSVFADGPRSGVLDLGCGAGAVTRHALAAGIQELIALDISAHALKEARIAAPSLLGLVASADRIPLADQTVALVASQFGIEYADRVRAAGEIGRVLKPGGAFHAVVHLKGGAIDAECRDHLARAEAIERSQYIPAVRAFYKAVYAHDRAPSPTRLAEMDAAFEAFSRAQSVLVPEIQAGGIAAQLANGARDHYQRRRAYTEEQALVWIDGFAAEIEAYAGRMRSMLDAAMAPDEASALLARISPKGSYEVAPILVRGQEAALRLTARV